MNLILDVDEMLKLVGITVQKSQNEITVDY